MYRSPDRPLDLHQWRMAEGALHCVSGSTDLALCGVDLSTLQVSLTCRADQSPEILICSVCRGVLAMVDRLGGDARVDDVRLCGIDAAGVIHLLRDIAGPDDQPWFVCAADLQDPDLDPRLIVRLAKGRSTIYVDFRGRRIAAEICAECRRRDSSS